MHGRRADESRKIDERYMTLEVLCYSMYIPCGPAVPSRYEAGAAITFNGRFLSQKKVGNFGEKPFVWEFLLGGDASKKRIKKITRKTHHGGVSSSPRRPDLVCKISFAFSHFLVAVANLISFCRIYNGWRSVVCRRGARSKKGV